MSAGAGKPRRLPPVLKSAQGIAALLLIAVEVFLAVAAPFIWGHSAAHENIAALNQGPSAAHFLGTDSLGRDNLARVLVATRLSLGLAVLATFLATVAGCVIGGIPPLLHRRYQRWIGSIINTWLAFPVIILGMFIAIMLGPGSTTAVIALVATMTPGFARLVQTLAAGVGGSEYLAAARLLGVSRRRQLVRYILPNIAEPVILNVTLSVGGALLALSTLSFLGLGVQPPSYDWGQLLGQALNSVYVDPMEAIGPGVAVIIAGLSFSFLGEVLSNAARDRSMGGGISRGERRATPVISAATPARRSADGTGSLLDVEDLAVSYPMRTGRVSLVHDVSFSLARHEILGIVGESGSGKTLTASAASKLITAPGQVDAQKLTFDGKDLRFLSDRQMRSEVGAGIGYVFQDSATALNPAIRLGRQLGEVVRVHKHATRSEAVRASVGALDSVSISMPERRIHQFPFQLSGGMRQRASIAMARMGDPELIVADEPTTALDVVVQAQVLQLLRSTCSETGASAIVISHDISVVASICNRVLVMYAGTIVEDLSAEALRTGAAHPYTRALIASLPTLETDKGAPLVTIPGRPPDAAAKVVGCAFAPRCAFATARCRQETPALVTRAGGRVACWHPRTGESLLDEPSADAAPLGQHSRDEPLSESKSR
ncbi:MAG: dipeptide/oligopeptide/nickel ABC transporter permease/ATP-binding protein [Acidimicrobiales bacterium]